jgi:hypothetical protein
MDVTTDAPNVWIVELPREPGVPEGDVPTSGAAEADQLGELVRDRDVLLFRVPVVGGAPSDLRIVGSALCLRTRPDQGGDTDLLIEFEVGRPLETPVELTRDNAGTLWTLSWFRDHRYPIHGLSARERVEMARRLPDGEMPPISDPGTSSADPITIDELLDVADAVGNIVRGEDVIEPYSAVQQVLLTAAAAARLTPSRMPTLAEMAEMAESLAPTIDERLEQWIDLHQKALSQLGWGTADSGFARSMSSGWFLDARALGLVALADAAARRLDPVPVAGERHLAASCLAFGSALYGGPGNDQLEPQIDHIRELIVRGAAPAHERTWQIALGGPLDPRPLATIESDRPTGIDALDRMPDVRAFAQSITARDLAPPLAIGVFGDWGSGKSFFMRKLRDEIQRINVEVQRHEPPTAISYCERVVQVEFNAWHYVDVDLWASLVHHLLKNLTVLYEADNETKQRILTEEVLGRLETATKSVEDAHDRLRIAQSDLSEQRRNTIASKKQLAAAELAAARYSVSDVVRAALANPDAAATVRAARDELGLTGVGQALGDVLDAANEASAVARSTAAMLRVTEQNQERRQAQKRRLVGWIAVAAVVSVVTIGVGWLLDRFGGAPTIGSIAAIVGQIAALGATAAAWLHRQIDISKGLVERLASARATLTAQEQTETAAARKEYERLLTSEADAKTAVVEAEEFLAASERRLATARNEVDQLRVERRLYDFVNTRTETYRAHLGLVSKIQEDFRELERLIAEWRHERDVQRGLADATTDERRRWEAIRSDPDLQPLGGLDRLVIYIDDLDRCPPDKVVKVLEAVHLLLAFDFIVVVVGVDARWVGNALRAQYPLLLGGATATEEIRMPEADRRAVAPRDPPSNATEQLPAHRTATEHDYLEKIFQIPYWLEPMNRDDAGRLLRRLFRMVRSDVARSTAATSAEMVAPSDGSFSALTIDDAADEQITSMRSRIESAEQFDPQPASLTMSRTELDLMSPLYDLIGRSPRATKHFANVYRVVRVSLDEASADDWTGDGHGECDAMAAMLLLAIICGAPQSSASILAQLDRVPPAGRWSEIADTIDLAIDPNAVGEAHRWEAARQLLMVDSRWSMLTTDRVRKLVPRLAQYSFRSGHIDFVPGPSSTGVSEPQVARA